MYQINPITKDYFEISKIEGKELIDKYRVDTAKNQCTCNDFKFSKKPHKCKHIKMCNFTPLKKQILGEEFSPQLISSPLQS